MVGLFTRQIAVTGARLAVFRHVCHAEGANSLHGIMDVFVRQLTVITIRQPSSASVKINFFDTLLTVI